MISMALPGHLVERIVAMLPYPDIFKTRVLSKAWLARLSPVSSQEDDQAKKLLGVSFQKLLLQHCSKWKTFSPVLVSEKDLVSYDRASNRWGKISRLSFLLENHLSSTVQTQDIEGALMLIAHGSNNLCVANVFTESWKRLPLAPETNQQFPGIKLVSDIESYKVIELFSDLGYSFAKIYDSQSGAWSSKRVDIAADLIVLTNWGQSLNGVLYWVVCRNEMAWGLLVFNVKEETFTVIQMSHLDIPSMESHHDGHLQLMVHNGSLLLLVYVDPNDNFDNLMIVMKIDLESWRWLEVSRSSFDGLSLSDFCHGPTSDGDSIFFMDMELECVLAYDMHTEEWSVFGDPETVPSDLGYKELQIASFSFQPGLNPFLTP